MVDAGRSCTSQRHQPGTPTSNPPISAVASRGQCIASAGFSDGVIHPRVRRGLPLKECAVDWLQRARRASGSGRVFETGLGCSEESLAYLGAAESPVEETTESGCLNVADDELIGDPTLARRELVMEA